MLGTTSGQQLAALTWDSNTVVVDHGLRLGNSDIYFTRTDHRHTGFGNTSGLAAIENDSGDYQALMILGRTIPGRGRIVKLYDYLEINGRLDVTSSMTSHTGNMTVTVGATIPNNSGGDAIVGSPNLFLSAAGTVFIKQGFQARGMDVAERFPATGPLQAGDVVVFDSALGVITPCDRATDNRVVGIVSEAAAFILGTEAHEPAVALCGRVPCKVDADIAPIAPGDLLTTSPTRGYAQKANDLGQAAGAIIGKALEARSSGRGEILVLVTVR